MVEITPHTVFPCLAFREGEHKCSLTIGGVKGEVSRRNSGGVEGLESEEKADAPVHLKQEVAWKRWLFSESSSSSPLSTSI